MNKRIKLLIALAVIVLAALITASIIQSNRFRILSITPNAKGTVSTSFTTFQIQTNQDLADNVDYMKQLDDPTHHVKAVKIVGRSLKVSTTEHTANQAYSFTVKNLRSKSGATIDAVTFSYTAKYVPYEKLTKEEKLLLDEQKNDVVADPILSHLPHSTLDFSLAAEFGEPEGGATQGFVLRAKLFLSAADVRTGEAQAMEAYKKEVADYITSLGLKPESYTIQYQVIRQ